MTAFNANMLGYLQLFALLFIGLVVFRRAALDCLREHAKKPFESYIRPFIAWSGVAAVAMLLLVFPSVKPLNAAIQYAGGTNKNVQCTATAGTKQELSDCVEDNLVLAGWTVISGSHTTSVLLESAITPTALLQMRLALTQGTNCLILKGRNVGNTKAAANGQWLLPAAAKVFRVVADKYQYFVYTDGSPAARSFAAGGVLYVPSFAGITEAIWTLGNSNSDSDTNKGPSFKDCLGLFLNCNGTSGQINYWVTLNGTQQEQQAGTNNTFGGVPQLLVPYSPGSGSTTGVPYRWFDGSAFVTDPLMAFAVVAPANALPSVNGQLWDGAIITDAIVSETSLTFDSHNWISVTNNNVGNFGTNTIARGTLVIVVP